MAEVRQAYRTVLKVVDRHITGVTGNRRWRDYVREEFRKQQQEANSSTSTVEQKLQLARDYVRLVTDVHAQKDLLISYNITTSMGASRQQVLQRSAARVGLQLPVQQQHEESS
eukprot:jgi/Chlat1/6280/Chrsp44S05778